MSLIQRVTALAQAVAADIKALYAGKAEKEHTHTAAQVSGLGTAATKNIGIGINDLPDCRSFGLGSNNLPSTPRPTPETRTGYYNDGTQNHIHLSRVGSAGRYGFRISVAAPSGEITVTPYYAGKQQTTRKLYSNLNTLEIGASKNTALTALNLTQQEKAIKDPSGLWVESGALTNDMSSYLSSKTYAEMRTKLGVVPVEVVQSSGYSPDKVMSQEAVTYSLKRIEDRLEKLEFAMSPIINFDGEMGTIGYWLNRLGG